MSDQKEFIFHGLERLIRYELFVFIGLIISFGALAKLIFNYNFSSDWFWFISGLGFTIEGTIALYKQRKFDRKYKVVPRE